MKLFGVRAEIIWPRVTENISVMRIVIIFSLFCGVAIPKPQMPGFWRAWLYDLDPFTR
jgi:ABC-type multidrug transport system permease subunit